MKRIIRYLKSSTSYGLLYSETSSKISVCCTEAGWGGDTDDYRSTSD